MTTPDEVYELAAEAYGADSGAPPSAWASVVGNDAAFRAAVDAAFAAGRRAGEEAVWDRAIRVVSSATVDSAPPNGKRAMEAFQQTLVASLKISRRWLPLDAEGIPS